MNLRRLSAGLLLALLGCVAWISPLSAQGSADKQLLDSRDNQVVSALNGKCFTPELALGTNYGTCTWALTLLNQIEPDAKKQNILLQGTTLAAALGFLRKADGTWDDRYTRLGPPQSTLATMQLEQAELQRAAEPKPVFALLEKCVSMSACSTAELETIVREADALRKEACGGADPCTDGNIKLMSFEEKMLIATGNRARDELAGRIRHATEVQNGVCLGGTPEQVIARCTTMINSGGLTGATLAVALRDRAIGYTDSERYAECVADNTDALTRDPTLAHAALNRGNCYYSLDKLALGLADFDRVIALNQSEELTAIAYDSRGSTHHMLGQHDLALADYTKAIARRPNFAMAFINRAWVEQVVGQEAAALADADKAYTLDPNSAQVRDMRDQIYAKARQRTASVAPAATATGFNGDWRGDSSGNLVRIETRTNGLFVTPVSQNAGQSAQGILYTTSTATTFRYNRDSVIEVLGPAQIRVTNADGWTDVFRPVRSSAAQYQQPQPPAAPQTGECIGSNDYCYAIKHGCTPGVCMAPPGWNGSLLLPPRSLRPERRRATADAVERA